MSAAADRHAANSVQLIDAVHALRHPEIFERSSNPYDAPVTFDFSHDSGEGPA
jgi:hypothetical protein